MPELSSLVVDNTLRLSVETGIGFDPAVINQEALRWARDFSHEWAMGLTNTTRNQLSEVISAFVQTPGMTIGDIERLIEPTFGVVRAEMIAVTETTRAYSEATNELQGLLRAETPELTVTRVWNTMNDEWVCVICGPLEGAPEEEFAKDFPKGPPAHPNCRCSSSISFSPEEQLTAEYEARQAEREAWLREQGLVEEAPEPWASSDTLRQRVQEMLLERASISERTALIEQYIKEHRSDTKTKIRKHGMTNPEPMRWVEFDGIPYYYRDTVKGRGYITKTLRFLAQETKIPEAISHHTNNIYLSTQQNNQDAYWEQQYNLTNFRSLATGGRGEIVVYDDPIGVKSLSHEMGHNLAWGRYGTTTPPQGTDYSRATADPYEPPVSKYAGNSIAEDFAEAIAEYVRNPTGLQQIAPLRYNVIKRLLEDENYGG
jgi:hypothetical protein